MVFQYNSVPQCLCRDGQSFSGRLLCACLLFTGCLTHVTATVFVCSYCCLKTEVYLHATSMWSPHPDSEAACVCALRATTVKQTVHVANGSLRVTESHLRLCMHELSVCVCAALFTAGRKEQNQRDALDWLQPTRTQQHNTLARVRRKASACMSEVTADV